MAECLVTTIELPKCAGGKVQLRGKHQTDREDRRSEWSRQERLESHGPEPERRETFRLDPHRDH